MANVSRRDWLKWFGGGAAAVTVIGCATNKITLPDAAPDAAAGSPATTIGDNHSHAPHKMTVTAADIAAGVDKTYSIMGAANHDHMVTITAAQFAMLAQGQAVGDLSTAYSLDGHTHCCVTVIVDGSGSGSGSATCA